MTFAASVLADSVAYSYGKSFRLLTLQMTMPTIIHAEHLRHRAFSFSVASLRAMPTSKILSQISSNPFVPVHWGAAEPGMQAHTEIPPEQRQEAERHYRAALAAAISHAQHLQGLGLHKQVVNRLLMPYTWTTTVCTGSLRAWQHFWALRCHEMAEPHIRMIAELSRDAVRQSTPVKRRLMWVRNLYSADWHLPFVTDEERADDTVQWHLVSAARCARVSYQQHDGQRDLQKDLTLANKLMKDGHWSPFEHQACHLAGEDSRKHGNLARPWTQHRKCYENEYTPETTDPVNLSA